MGRKRIWTPREAQGLLTLNYNSLIIVTFLSMYNNNNNSYHADQFVGDFADKVCNLATKIARSTDSVYSYIAI